MTDAERYWIMHLQPDGTSLHLGAADAEAPARQATADHTARLTAAGAKGRVVLLDLVTCNEVLGHELCGTAVPAPQQPITLPARPESQR
jgi:hypothetical protein